MNPSTRTADCLLYSGGLYGRGFNEAPPAVVGCRDQLSYAGTPASYDAMYQSVEATGAANLHHDSRLLHRLTTGDYRQSHDVAALSSYFGSQPDLTYPCPVARYSTTTTMQVQMERFKPNQIDSNHLFALK